MKKKPFKIAGFEIQKQEKKLSPKAAAKQVAKLKKNTASTLEWMDVVEVRENSILLSSGKKEKLVKGYKILPHNIFLDASSEQVNRISRLRTLYNNIPFKLYHAFVFNPVNLDVQIAQLSLQYERETDAMIQQLIMDDIQKMMVFIENWRELEFFIMIQGEDSSEFDKQFHQLGAELRRSRLQCTELNKVDFTNYVSYTFENDMIHDYLFSKGTFAEIYENEVEGDLVEHYG